MSRPPMRIVGSAMLAVLIVASLAAPAIGVTKTVKSGTSMSIEPIAPIVWGQRASVIAHLRISGGAALGDTHVDLHLAGEIAGGHTDARGTAIFDIHTPTVPGDYLLKVTFNGSHLLLPSEASTTLTVQKRLFTIHTEPAHEGLTFDFNGTTFASDANGIARLVVDPSFDDTQRPATPSLQIAPGVEERFARWRIHNKDLYATYEIYYSIKLRFVDLAGDPVDAARVTKVDLKSAIGSNISVSPQKAFTVLGQRVVPIAGELQPKDVAYAAQDVVVDGANVIHAAQQRFTPSKQQVWTITLLFYSAHLTVRDALFGFPLDANVRVTYPNGQRLAQPTRDGQLGLTAMARGNYWVVAETWGLSFLRPVALSRNQNVELKVISYLDIAVVIALVLIVVLGLVFIGRPALTRALRNRVRRPPIPVPAISGARLERALASAAHAAHAVPASQHPTAAAALPVAPRTLDASAPKARPTKRSASAHDAAAEPTAPHQAIRPKPATPHRGRSSAAAQATPVRATARRKPRVYVVQPGETLRSIAATVLGDESAWPEIHRANGRVVTDPEVVRPGTRLKIP